MDENQKTMTVFFSWQSDVSQDATTRVIRECLRWASSELESTDIEKNLRLDLDEATRNLPGSPNVVESILKKIEAADVFVCDITTINKERSAGNRPVPNPNVLYELGFAMAHLGWNRIVLLFNDSYGDFDEDVPFDLKGQRISRYSCELPIPDRDALTKREKRDLREKMVQPLKEILLDALTAILVSQPPRPSELKELSADELRKSRDRQMLTEVMSTFPLNMMDNFIDSLLGRRMSHDIFNYWEDFSALVKSSSFHLNDIEAKEHIQKLYGAWESCFSFYEYFDATREGDFIFKLEPGDAPLPEGKKNALREMEQCALNTRQALDNLLSTVRKKYPEIDLERTSKVAWNQNARLKEESQKRSLRIITEDLPCKKPTKDS